MNGSHASGRVGDPNIYQPQKIWGVEDGDFLPVLYKFKEPLLGSRYFGKRDVVMSLRSWDRFSNTVLTRKGSGRDGREYAGFQCQSYFR